MKDALTLALDEELFAIDARSVREIMEMVPVTRVPGAPAAVDAVINVRGRIVPLVDLRTAFGMTRRPPDLDTRIVVIEVDFQDEPLVVGLLADSVHDVAEIEDATIEAPPRIGMRWPAELVAGIGRRGDAFVILPDLTRIFCAIAGEAAPPQERAA